MPSAFATAATTLIGNGYSPMPVAPRCEPLFEGHRPPSGKEPGRLDLRADGEERWVRLKGWTTFCTRQAHPAIVAHWSRMPDAGVCVATGFSNLVAVDIDRDDLIADILSVLPDALVGKVGKRGATYFFRATEPIPSTPYKDSDGQGLLDLLSGGRQSVVPGTIHPDTGEPYRWSTDRTLLTTPIADLPEFTAEHRVAMEEVLRRHGWGAPEPKTPRREATERPVRAAVADDMHWHDDVNQAALANLHAWVEDLRLPKGHWQGDKYRAVAPWRTSGSGRADAQRSANLSFHHTGIRDFGDQGWTPIRVVAKANHIPFSAAAAWLRQRLGLPEERLILLNAGTVKPTYPDRTVSLADAGTELRGVLDDFEPEMKAWRIYRNQSKVTPPLIYRKPPTWGVKIETSGGKTHTAAEMVAAWSRRAWRLAYVVPTIKLGVQVAQSIADQGGKAQVYRGREQVDPEAPGEQMCRNLPAALAATALGVSVRPAVCMRRIEEKLVQCPFATVCGHEKQREAKPDVWIITSASLAYERPDFIAELDGVVIDERFHDNAIGEPAVVDTAELWRANIELCNDVEHDFLTSMRAKLRAVVEDNGDGPMSAAALDEHRIFVHDALRAATLEQRRVKPDVLRPDMKESGINLALYKHGARNKLARDVGALWEEIATFLTFGGSHSGRIAVSGSTLTLTPLHPFHPSWSAPVLALDATLPTPEILDAALFGDEIVGSPATAMLKADIAIKWPDHVHVRQVMSAPVSMGALGVGEMAKRHPRNERDILRYIRQRAALVAPAPLGVISYLELKERLSGQVPANVAWMHFGATSGLNDFESVAGLVVVGRWWVSPESVEATASVLSGRPVAPAGEFYRKRTGGIRMTEGPAVPAAIECHPNPVAEAVRWGISEGELSQAIGRLRGPRRSSPCFLDILSDIVMPITVDEVVDWNAVCPGAEADMLAEGVVLANREDAMKAFGLTKWAADNAETRPESLIGIHIRDSGRVSPIRRFTYRRVGSRGPKSSGHYLPATIGGPAALKVWLESRLGAPITVTVEPVKAKDSQASQAIFARIGRDIGDRTTRPLTGFRETLQAIEDFFAALGEDDDG
jgi:hypothetical protein